MSINSKSQPTIFVIFGGTGDLNSRKLAPALYNLFFDNWLAQQFSIIGTGRTKYIRRTITAKPLMKTSTNFRESGKAEDNKWQEFSGNMFYQISDLTKKETYEQLSDRINAHKAEWQSNATVIFYLAVSPNFFKVIAENIHACGTGKRC